MDALSEMEAAEEATEADALSFDATSELQQQTVNNNAIRPLMGHHRNFMSSGLLNEDEALKLILQSTSGSSSARSATPILSSSPRTVPTPPRPASLVRATAYGPKSSSPSRNILQVDGDPPDRGLEMRAPVTEDQLAKESGEEEATTYCDGVQSRVESRDGDNDSPKTEETSSDGKKGEDNNFTSLKPREEDEVDEEEEEDVYRENGDYSPNRGSSTTSLKQIMKSYEKSTNNNIERLEEVEEATEVREGDEVKFVVQSAAARLSEVQLASPRLSGFIESWNPFASGRYFDTPPPIGQDMSEETGLGFTLQKDVSVGPLNVEDSQRLMRVFDKVYLT